jgi:hypothetical protein
MALAAGIDLGDGLHLGMLSAICIDVHPAGALIDSDSELNGGSCRSISEIGCRSVDRLSSGRLSGLMTGVFGTAPTVTAPGGGIVPGAVVRQPSERGVWRPQEVLRRLQVHHVQQVMGIRVPTSEDGQVPLSLQSLRDGRVVTSQYPRATAAQGSWNLLS